MTEQNQIADLNTGKSSEVTQPVTPEQPGVTNVTPSQPASDAGSDAKLKELEAIAKAREEDIRKLKSTYDKQLDQTRRQFEAEQKKLQEELQKAKLSTMTDEQKAQFERQLELEEAQRWREEAMKYKQQIEEQEVRSNYAQYFQEMGVPKEQLNMNGDLNALVQSGWEGVQNQLTSMKTKLAELENLQQQPSQPVSQTQQPMPQQRTPITSQPNSPAPKVTWADIRKQYPNEEEFYTKLERGEIDPRIIPTE